MAPAKPHLPALEPRSLVHWLRERGLVEVEQLASLQLDVQPASQRNHNFVVRCAPGSSFFVKQAISQSTRTTIAREAEFYARVWQSISALQAYVPELVAYDDARGLLVLELKTGCTTLEGAKGGRRHAPFFGRLGEAMAALHAQSGAETMSEKMRQAPLITRVSALSARELGSISAAGLELVQTIQRYPGFEQALADAFQVVDERRLTHNDFRSANCLVAPGRRPVIVDWEFAALGDPSWDVGCVFADFLISWLLSMPLGSQAKSYQLPRAALQPITALQPPMRRFWQVYRGRRALQGDEAMTFLIRATRCAAFKLVQRAYEMCQHATTLSAAEIYLMQTSWNILRRPAEAAVRMFGIPLGALLDETNWPWADEVNDRVRRAV